MTELEATAPDSRQQEPPGVPHSAKHIDNIVLRSYIGSGKESTSQERRRIAVRWKRHLPWTQFVKKRRSPLGAITSTISPILGSAFCSTILYEYLPLGNCGWFPRIMQSLLQKDWRLKTGGLIQSYTLRRKVITKVPELSNIREKEGSLGHKGQKCKPDACVCESLKLQVLAGGIQKGREHPQQLGTKTPLADTFSMPWSMPWSERRSCHIVLIHLFSKPTLKHTLVLYLCWN